jgi:hypothetical protein
MNVPARAPPADDDVRARGVHPTFCSVYAPKQSKRMSCLLRILMGWMGGRTDGRVGELSHLHAWRYFTSTEGRPECNRGHGRQIYTRREHPGDMLLVLARIAGSRASTTLFSASHAATLQTTTTSLPCRRLQPFRSGGR